MSLLLATPLPVRPPFVDINSSRGVSIALPAMTKILALTEPFSAVARPLSLLYLMKLISADVAVFADDDLAGDGPVSNRHETGVHRVIKRDGRIVFRLDRADRNAVGVAGAGAPIPIGLRSCAPPEGF